MEKELILFDRIEKIKSINSQYDLENKSYISFSGGKDSTVLHHLIDMALPDNKIPRVFINTGIEYKDIVEFVKSFNDSRFEIIQPTTNIKEMLNSVGYPFKSKQHSHNVAIYQRNRTAINEFLINDTKVNEDMPRGTKSVVKYFKGIRFNKIDVKYDMSNFSCPKSLKYQFSNEFNINISDKCCYKLKKEPIHKWEKENNKNVVITGMRKGEGGNRTNLNCIVTDKSGKVEKFHPLAVIDNDFIEWFIKEYNIELCRLYLPPFSFNRTGCKGCPFSLDLQKQLDTMKELLPNEAKQCENIWLPVYEEYRRIGYRLK